MRNKRKILNTKKFLFAGIVACVGVLSVFYLFSLNEKFVSHSNFIDTKISQYSDKNITQNAISTNLKFEHMAFDASAPTNLYPFSDQFATVIRTIKSFTVPQTKIRESPKEHGSWVWTPIMDMSSEYIEFILSGAKENGVNTIYISVDTYLDIFVMKKGEEREKLKKEFSDKLEDFITRANQKGIVVDAEAGWRNWAEENNTYKAFAVVNYVKNFNATHENKFRGFQYDIEPYLLDSYKKNQAFTLKNFVKLVDQTEQFIGASSLAFSVVIPDFYDKKDRATPKFLYNGKKDYTFRHLLNILERRNGSSIVIMSYRNFAEGNDGSIEISKNEMQTAQSGAFNTRIIIAQETGEVAPPYITFHDTSKNYLLGQIGKINSTFNSHPNFGGIAIHYASALLALK